MRKPIDGTNDQRNLTLKIYVLILVIIASLAVATYISQRREILLQEESAFIINTSGRQRMLSQYIMLESELWITNPSAQQRIQLNDAITLMEENHKYLLSLSPLSEDLSALYFDPLNTDSRVRSYLNSARNILEGTQQAENLLKLQQQRYNLLASLDDIVTQYQYESEQRAQQLQFLQQLMIALIVLLLICEAFFIILPTFRRLKNYIRLATIDSLSKVNNRRSFMTLLRKEHQRCKRYALNYSLLMIDIDDFKTINDRYGHHTGDRVIREMADTLKQHLRATDQLGRIGGEEFAALLIQTNTNSAIAIAEKLRAAVEQLKLQHDQHDIQFTISIGIATYHATSKTTGQTIINTTTMLKQADDALYRAKNQGKNCVVFSDSAPVDSFH